MSVIKDKISDDIRNFVITPEMPTHALLTIQLGKYDDPERGYYISMFVPPGGAQETTLDIFDQISAAHGLIAKTSYGPPPSDPEDAVEVEVEVQGKYAASVNQLDCLEHLLKGLHDRGLCSGTDAKKVMELEKQHRSEFILST